MATLFTCDIHGPTQDLPHFWEHTIGSGHAPLALRADWQAQMRRAHQELGFQHVRFHGLLSDDMGTLVSEGETDFYSFFNADQVFDFLLSIGMRPFVELSFMPTSLASGAQTVFHYGANVSAPKDYNKWSFFIHKLVSHWVDRHGLEEVKHWLFEIWNEPNLSAFGDGQQETYFKLYRATVEAIKSVNPSLQVGGPATASNAWILDFLHFCKQNNLPADFITTHHYPTDSFGRPGDDTEAQLAASRRSVLRDEARAVRQQAGGLPVYYTEWCTSSNPRDAMHDEPYAAAFITKTIMEAQGLVQAYSYWTFSDIFEENYFPSVPFHGGFGLMNIHGIAKPAYRAYELLHGLGTQTLHVQGAHTTVDVWVVKKDGALTVLLTNFALPRHPIGAETIDITIAGLGPIVNASLQTIDADHAHAKKLWQAMGSPDYLSPADVAKLHDASCCAPTPFAVHSTDADCTFSVTLAPQSVTAVTLWSAGVSPAGKGALH